MTMQYTTFQCSTIHSTIQYPTLQCSTLQYTTVHYITMHYTTLQCTTLHYNAVHYITMQYTTVKMLYTTLQCSTLQYNSVHYITLQYITVQCSTLQYTTVQCSTLHYNAAHNSTMQYTTLQCSIPVLFPVYIRIISDNIADGQTSLFLQIWFLESCMFFGLLDPKGIKKHKKCDGSHETGGTGGYICFPLGRQWMFVCNFLRVWMSSFVSNIDRKIWELVKHNKKQLHTVQTDFITLQPIIKFLSSSHQILVNSLKAGLLRTCKFFWAILKNYPFFKVFGFPLGSRQKIHMIWSEIVFFVIKVLPTEVGQGPSL